MPLHLLAGQAGSPPPLLEGCSARAPSPPALLPSHPPAPLAPWFLALRQGFIQFRLSGEKIDLDVDALNEQLKVQGPDRLR